MRTRLRPRLPWRAARCTLIGALVLLAAGVADARQTSLDLYGGESLYRQTAGDFSTGTLVAALRHGGPPGTAGHSWAAVAAPLTDSAPWWVAGGGAHQLGVPGTPFGLEFGGSGYAWREPEAAIDGFGATLELRPNIAVRLSPSFQLQAETGWAQYLHAAGDVRSARGGPGAAARLTRNGLVRTTVGARWVQVPEGNFVAAHAEFQSALGPALLHASAEQWIAGALRENAWSLAAATPVGGSLHVWSAVRQEAREPLYWNARRISWSAGVSIPLTRPPLIAAPVARAGTVTLRVPASAAAGPISVAGEFSDWEPVPMHRAGGAWQIELALTAGAYRYSFIDGNGRWFVPAATPGRMEDGFGGYVALLVVE
jgi:hypothetical protein